MKEVVLINGGSRGIGAACVRAFTESGYRVAFTFCRSQSAAEELVAQTGALAIRADSASAADIRTAVSQTEKTFGQVDILVNNAGIGLVGLFQDVTSEKWERLLHVDLEAPMTYAKEVLPGMISRKCGKIINVSSMWGQVGASCEVHYSTVKAGLIGFTKALAKEVGPSGITVNAVCPGFIDTEMNACFSADDVAQIKEETPLYRVGTPDDVAASVLFLAGKGGDFITGQVLSPNGGLVIV